METFKLLAPQIIDVNLLMIENSLSDWAQATEIFHLFSLQASLRFANGPVPRLVNIKTCGEETAARPASRLAIPSILQYFLIFGKRRRRKMTSPGCMVLAQSLGI
jgi:hypothetical protein